MQTVPTEWVRDPSAPVQVLTERVVRRLPGSPVFWILIWATTPVGLAWVLDSFAPRNGEISILEAEPLGTAISVFVIVLSLWAARYLSERALGLDGFISDLSLTGVDVRWLAGMGSIGGPILLAVLMTLFEDAALLQPLGLGRTLALAPLQFLAHLPLAVGVWVVLVILVSMDRIGAVDLRLDTSSGDPSLGLSPLGKLAVQAFAIFAAGALPILLANTDSTAALMINGGSFLIGAGVFALGLWRVHRQMVDARDESIREARRRLRDITRRIETSGSTPLEDRDATLLMAADLLERRAREVATWPLTGGLYARLGAIVFAVLIGLTIRVIATAIGV